MNLDELNANFALPERLHFVAGGGGLPKCVIDAEEASAELYLYGGQVTHFQPHGEKPILWLSPDAIYKHGTPIRGGIPIIWPWFGKHPKFTGLPNHGEARIQHWEVIRTGLGEEGEVTIALRLESRGGENACWPYPYELVHEVTVGRTLTVRLTAHNRGLRPCLINIAFHTYFRVGDVSRVAIDGFDGRFYEDQVDEMKSKKQVGPVRIGFEIDRVYIDGDSEIFINDSAWERRIRIDTYDSDAAVVWNPWIEKAGAMIDFPDEGFRDMVCVETGNLALDARGLLPGTAHVIQAIIGLE